MRIIDRYVLRQFVQTYVICFISLTGLYVVIDAFGNLDEFLSFADSGSDLAKVMTTYYAFRSVAFFDRIGGLLALIAALFTVTWLQRHQEMTALLAAGISKLRVVAPLLGASVAVSLLAAANRELVLPRMRAELSRNAQDLSGENARDLPPRYDNATGVLLRGSALVSKDQRIAEPSFLLPPRLDRYGRHLAAADAFYQPPQGDRPGGYLLVDVAEPKGVDKQPSLALDDRPVLLTPRDNDWLEPGQCFLASDLSFEMLQGGSTWRAYSSTAELIRGLGSPSLDFGPEVCVAVHARLVQPLLDMTLLMLGLPLVLSRNTRNVFVAIGLCVALALVFMLVVLACQYLGSTYWIRPAQGAWLPLVIFVPIALYLSEALNS